MSHGSMYAFKNPVYLVLGIILVLFGVVLMARSYILIGAILLLLGFVMSIFAAYQIGQASSSPGLSSA